MKKLLPLVLFVVAIAVIWAMFFLPEKEIRIFREYENGQEISDYNNGISRINIPSEDSYQVLRFYDGGPLASFSIEKSINYQKYIYEKYIFTTDGILISRINNGEGFDLEIDHASGAIQRLSQVVDSELSGFTLLYDEEGDVLEFSSTNIGVMDGHYVEMYRGSLVPKKIEYRERNNLVSEFIFSDDGLIASSSGDDPPIFSEGIDGYYFCNIQKKIIKATFFIQKRTNGRSDFQLNIR